MGMRILELSGYIDTAEDNVYFQDNRVNIALKTKPAGGLRTESSSPR